MPNAVSLESHIEVMMGAFLGDSPRESLSLRSPAKIEANDFPLVSACW